MKIAHICAYPGKGKKHISDSGVASYTKNLLANMPNDTSIGHYVLCNRAGGKDERYQEDGVVVMRCFDRGPGFVGQLNKRLKRLSPDVVHIQHELSLFGGIITAFLLPLLVFKWRRKVTVTLHGVVDIASVDGAFVRANGYSPVPAWAVKFGLRLLYGLLVRLPKSIVVHEPHFKRLLVSQYGAVAQKVAVIPHGVEDLKGVSQQKVRETLGIGSDKKVVLFMGYAAGYKGIDLLIEGFAAYAQTNPNAYLIVGAGVHPKFKDDPSYQAVYSAYQQKAERLIPSDQYRWVGFIPEDQVAAYYCAADVSVYPYTLALASSGPMSFAIGLNRPFLASSAFSDVFSKELIFDSTPQAFAAKLQEFFGDTQHFDKQIAWLRSQRLWRRTSLKTAELYKQTG